MDMFVRIIYSLLNEQQTDSTIINYIKTRIQVTQENFKRYEKIEIGFSNAREANPAS